MGLQNLISLLGDEITDPEEGVRLRSSPSQAWRTDSNPGRILPPILSGVAISESWLCRSKGYLVRADGWWERFLYPSVSYNLVLKQGGRNNGCW